MSAELVGIISIGVTLLAVGISLGALIVTLMMRQERLMDSMDERLRHLEQGQAHLSGELSALKDFFVHRLGPE